MEDNRDVHVKQGDVGPDQCQPLPLRQVLNIIVNVEGHIVGHHEQVGDGKTGEYGVGWRSHFFPRFDEREQGGRVLGVVCISGRRGIRRVGGIRGRLIKIIGSTQSFCVGD